MKKIGLILFCCLLVPNLSAQNVKIISEGIVLDTLKGNIMRVRKSRVLRIADGNNKIYLISKDGKNWISGKSMVIKSDDGSQIQLVEAERPEISNYKKGYFGAVQTGILLGNRTADNKAPFSFTVWQGYRLNSWFAPGIETGVDFFDDGVIPIHGTASFFLTSGQFTPVLSLKGGWSIPLAREKEVSTYYYPYSDFYYSPTNYVAPGTTKLKTQAGLSLNPEISIMRMMNNDMGWIFSFGYRYQRLIYQQGETGDADYYRKTNDINRLSLRVGLFFR